jgi:hypothetical protein
VRSRATKVPYTVNGHRASSVAPRDWATFSGAVAAFRTDKFAGLGFVFVAGGGIVGIDLDDCLSEDGELKPWACGIVERFAFTYTEVSPSGTGLKIWGRGSVPENLPGVPVASGGSIEIYDRARYFTVTGKVFRGAPLEVEDHAEDVLYMYERLTQKKKKVWPLQPLAGGRIPVGAQHSTLVSIAGTLRARHVCDEAVLACLLAVNAHQLERPAPTENIARIVRSSRNWATR